MEKNFLVTFPPKNFIKEVCGMSYSSTDTRYLKIQFYFLNYKWLATVSLIVIAGVGPT